MGTACRIFIFYFIFCLILICISAPVIVSAVAYKEGFVEYESKVSLDFDKTIEISLTHQETKHVYTHRLFSANDYRGNFGIPFGSYSLVGKVITDKDDFTSYAVVFASDVISINNERLAVPVSLTVEEFSDFLEPEPSEGYFDWETYLESENLGEDVSIGESDATVPTDVFPNNTLPSTENSNTSGISGGSLLISVIITLVVLIAGVVVYVLLKNRG